MSIEKVPVFENFPAQKEQSKLVLWIKTRIYRIFARRINWLLDRILTDGYEFIVEGNEPGDDGNWRIIIISGDLKVQKRISGEWDTGHTFSGS